MLVLVDTGILLRLMERTDPQYASCRAAIIRLRTRGDQPVTSSQNIAEFWNVSTRPSTSRGGYGLSITETERRLRITERLIRVLPDMPGTYNVWRELVVSLEIKGVQVHDARLVAWMKAQVIAHVMTLNGADFARYQGVVVLSPEDVLAGFVAQAKVPP